MVDTRVFRQGVCLALFCYLTVLPGGTLSFSAEPEAEVASIPEEAQEGPGGITRAQLRHEVMRFSRSFLAQVNQAADAIEKHSLTPQARLAAHQGKLMYGASSLDIAIGPNPEVNLLDMVVFVTLARIVVEEYWVPQVFGAAGQDLLEVFRRFEADIWAIAAKVLTPEQQQDLRNLIQEWRKRHPDQRYVAAVRFGDFSEHIGKSTLADAQRSGGLFGVKGVTHSVDEIRLLSERLLFYAQLMPFLVRWQAERLFLTIAATPEMQQVLANLTHFTETASEFAQVAKALPGQISEEREKTIDQLMAQEQRVRGVLTDLRQTLTAGTALASQLNTTVGSVDGLVARLHARRKEPVDIKDVVKVLEQTTLAIQSTEQLLTSPGWDQRFPQLIQLVNRTESEGEEWSDHAFRRAIVLILIFFVALFAYRFASAKLIGSRRARGPAEG